MEKLPIELVDHVCHYLTLCEMNHLALLNKTFNQIIKTNYFYAYCRTAVGPTIFDTFSNLMKNFAYFTRFYLQHHTKYDNFRIFKYVCLNNELKVAQWLFETFKHIEIELAVNSSMVFEFACMYGHLEMAKWLKGICKPTFSIIECALGYTFSNGHMEVIRWLCDMRKVIIKERANDQQKQIDLNLQIKKNNNEFFQMVCGKGHLGIAKWLLETYPNINIRSQKDNAFLSACQGGHLEIVKWLIQIEPKINVRSQNDINFQIACIRNHLAVAKWLRNFCPEINVRAEDDDAFKRVCQNGHIAVAEWLASICPNYVLTQKSPSITFEIINH